MDELPDVEIQSLLDGVRFGDRITITRANAPGVTATISGPALASPPDPTVGIDLLDGEPHVIRRSDGRVFGRIVDLHVQAGPHDA